MRFVGAAVAAGLFVLLCWDASRRLPEAFPSVGRCQANPAKYANREVWVIPGMVVWSEEDWFKLVHSEGEVRVHSRARPPVGVHAYVRGTFLADGTVLATGLELAPGFMVARAGVIILSLITLILFAGVFLRTFGWRDGAFPVREPHSAVAPQKPLDRN